MMFNVEYDAQVIQEFADALYSKATTIIVTTIIVSGVIGGALGFVLGTLIKVPDGKMLISVAVALVGGFIGYLIGGSRAFALKLQAQSALCLMQIESNTRREPDHIAALRSSARPDRT